MSNEPILDVMYARAVDEVASNLESALNFLCKYEALNAQNLTVLDDSYSDIDLTRQCFHSSLSRAQSNAFAFFLIFRGSSFSESLKIIETWTSKIHYLGDVFNYVEEYKISIKYVADSMRSGTLELPASSAKKED